MLHRGPSTRVVHTKSDWAPGILDGIAPAQLDTHANEQAHHAAFVPRRRAKSSAASGDASSAQQIRAQRRANEYVAYEPSTSSGGSRIHRPRLEVSKEMRDRAAASAGSMAAASSVATSAPRWSGVKPLMQHTTATANLISVSLAAVSSAAAGGTHASPASVAAAASAAAAGRSGVLSVSRVTPAPAAPPLSSRRQPHFVSPFGEAQARHRLEHQAKKDRGPFVIDQRPQQPLLHSPRRHANASTEADQRLTLHSSSQTEQTVIQRQQEQEQQVPRVSAQRLTVPHLPLHLTAPPPRAELDDGSLQPFDSEYIVPISAAPAAAPHTVRPPPDAQEIFSNFQAWFREQHDARLRHAASLATGRAGKRAKDDTETEESIRGDVTPFRQQRLWKFQQRMIRREERKRKKREEALAARKAAKASGDAAAAAAAKEEEEHSASDHSSPASAAASEDEADDPSHSDVSSTAFIPTLYSYPRLQFAPPAGSGSSASVKFQAHLALVNDYPELRSVWDRFVAGIQEHNGGERSSEGAVRNRVFAFRMDEGAGDGAGAAPATGEEHKESAASASIASGCEDGSDRGAGAKLLHLLHAHDLSNILLFVTESGGISSTLSTASASVTPWSESRSHRSWRQGCMVKTARIMLQDFVRIRGAWEVDRSNRIVAQSGNEEGGNAFLTAQEQDAPQPWGEEKSEEQRLVPHSLPSVQRLDGGGDGRDEPVILGPPLPAVSIFSLPLNGGPPIPLPLDDQNRPSPRRTVRAHPLPPGAALATSAQGNDALASASPAPLPPLLTAQDEELLRSEILQLLSGRAYELMAPSNLTRDHGAHRPRFLSLWMGYMSLTHVEQEAPSSGEIADSHIGAWRIEAARGIEGFAHAILSAESTSSSGGSGSGGGRMHGSVAPDGRAGLRLERKLRALTEGVEGLMLDGFANDRSSSDRKRSRSRGRAGDPLDPTAAQPSAHGLALRHGSGFSGVAVLQPGRPSSAEASTMESKQQSRAQRAQARLAAVHAAEEHAKAHHAPSSAATLRSTRRRATMHTAATLAASHASGNAAIYSAHSSRGPQAAPGSGDPLAWLAAQRARGIKAQFTVPSLFHLFHHHVQFVYQFKAKVLALGMRRGVLRRMGEAYDDHRGGKGQDSSGGAAPPFLLRILLLATGILLRWRTLHWKGVCHYLRGEVLCTALSPFVLHEQPALQRYEAEQTERDGKLPPPLAPHRLARNVLERDEMDARVEEFKRHYFRATKGEVSEATGGSGGKQAPVAATSKGSIADNSEEPPRDLAVHLMSMDVMYMTSSQYEQVRVLFSEPTLTRANIGAIHPPAFASHALLIFEWILLTLRCYNVWRACPLAFEEQSREAVEEQVGSYKQYISRVGVGSEEIRRRIAAERPQRTIEQNTLSGSNTLPASGHTSTSSLSSASPRRARRLSRKPPIPPRLQHQQHQSPRSSPGGANNRRSSAAASPSSVAEGLEHEQDDGGEGGAVADDAFVFPDEDDDAAMDGWPLSASDEEPTSAFSRPSTSGGTDGGHHRIARPRSGGSNATGGSSRPSSGHSRTSRPHQQWQHPARNLVSLLSRERPAATHTDELLSGWVARDTPRHFGSDSEAPSRRMG